MKHRHLDIPADTPPERLGLAALDDLLDRGDLTDWRPVLVAIARDPGSALSNRVLALCDANPHQGTSRLWRTWIHRRRALHEGQRSAPPEASLAELRQAADLSQQALATAVGMSQSDLSKLERRADVRLSTLRTVLAGLGQVLEVRAVDPATGAAVRLVIPKRKRPTRGVVPE